ncbi:MAG: nitroreductase family protein [Deltaproteobacteria bacterium]|nr:nitroreductase family protein [Deltaproteobacteria bacterium]
MDRRVTTIIDQEKCTGCGMCVIVCPSDTISIQDRKAVVSGERSLNCGHCAAVCPEGAIEVSGIDENTSSYKTFITDDRWVPHGEYDTGELVRLMRSRRSCRNFSDRPVERIVLEDLVKIGITAPSGSNSQMWTFTILPSKNEVGGLGERAGEFFRKINRIVEKSFLRFLLRLVGKKEFESYYQEHYERVKKGLEEWDKTGRDLLFHGATACIIVGSRPGASCPGEDALLATQNILLAAHSMGLGSCLIGYVVKAMRYDKGIQRFAGIPDEEEIYAIIALGYPDERYERTVGRKPFLLRYNE